MARRNHTKQAQKTLGTTKDTTKAIETRAGVLQDGPETKPEMEMYLQFAGNECSTRDIAEKVRDIWTKEMGRKADTMKKVSIYLKPEENAAYYVINGETAGKVPLV